MRTVFETARQVDGKTMSLQYLEALKVVGSSPSTKFVLPMELTGMLQGITDLTSRAYTDAGVSPATEPAPRAGA